MDEAAEGVRRHHPQQPQNQQQYCNSFKQVCLLAAVTACASRPGRSVRWHTQLNGDSMR
jgi:hypothetical protein